MQPIKVVVQGLGEIPSFKNQKVMGRSPKGRPILYTKTRVKNQMDRIIMAIEFQLRCSLLIDEIGTLMACIPPSKIASSLPLDDSLAWIPEHSVNWRRVKKGEEGFELTITQIEELNKK